MVTQWFCRLMGSELGPFTSKQLLEMARSHQIMPDDSVKKGADGNWVEAHRVQGLFDDPSGSSIIMAHLPPEAKQAVESKPEPAKAASMKAVAAPEPRPVKWYYISDHNKVGPLDFDELVSHGRQGLVKPDSRVWSTASPKWHIAKDIEGLVLGQPAQ
jgi:hypothetical protein